MSEIRHYGTPRHSGRYPWGSGGNPQRSKDFLTYVRELKKQGLTESQIAEGLNIKPTKLRARYTAAVIEKRAADSAFAIRLKEKGYSNIAIGKRMGINESSVRSLLNDSIRERTKILETTANVLKESVDKLGYIDVGAGVETHLGISRTKLDTAVSMLEDQGYKIIYIPETQVGTGKRTSLKVLAPPGTKYNDVYRNKADIKLVYDHSEDGGRTFKGGLKKPTSVNSDRIFVRYKEDGGGDKDGVIELRRGVEDLSLGKNRYAQVRIEVDGTHYMKGMAVYSDSVPDGYDIVYNISKPKGSTKDKTFKPVKDDDPTNPFGTTVRQMDYIDSKGKAHLSPLNLVNEEGDWKLWSKNLSSQFLSKQIPSVAKKQLKLAYDLKEDEFNEIMSLTNPAVRKRLLQTFSDEADSAAVHLKAAAFPKQGTYVILPITSLKDTEVYSTKYRPGETVVLIRHPHGGIFEIPQLIVTDKNPEAKKLLGRATDAIGINPKVAAQLSGADFDGDTVIVIPNKSGSIRTASQLKALKDFDPRIAYRGYDGMPVIKSKTKQTEMGKISNLITDMTVRGASFDEIARAVKHSMVVIDSENHKLNYRLSYNENGIAALKKKYQGSEKAGASTLISKAASEIRINERKPGTSLINPRTGEVIVSPRTGKPKRFYIDPNTGRKLYEETGRTYIINKKKVFDPVTGKKILVDIEPKILPAKTKVTRMEVEEDAYALSSGSKIEAVYADHANALKDLANRARKAMVQTPPIEYSESARHTYQKEVDALRSKLILAYRNKPLERQAQLLANKMVSIRKNSNPDMGDDDLKKIKGQELEKARIRTGAKKDPIEINDREWEAIQAGAISNSALSQILLNTDLKALKARATPRYDKLMSPAKTMRAQYLFEIGHTQSEVADMLGVSVSTIEKALE